MPDELEIRLLGGLQILRKHRPLTHFISNKVPALLAYLALNPRTQLREALAALLWGEMAEADAKNNLRQALSNLRKTVAPYLHITRDTVQFDPSLPHTLDVTEFTRGLQPSASLPILQATLALYHGDFLQGFVVREAPLFEDWLYAERVRYREMALQGLQTLGRLHATRGDYPQAIYAATRLLALDPWREETHRQLMLLHARNGQRTAALAQYETCRQVLSAELGVEPSAETNALYARLRAAGDSIPHNLPPQPGAFLGRGEELAQLETHLLNPNCRLLTLLGPGGIGKTRLALQSAAQALQRGLFLEGIYFISLEGVDDPALLASTIAEACHLPATLQPDPHTQVVTFLKAREVLLILDNFEQLLAFSPASPHAENADPGWMSILLQTAPRLKILVTSRARLNLQWEWVMNLEGLDYPSEPASLVQGTESSAVRLLLARAKTVRQDFTFSPAVAPALVRISQLLEGTPLALELAAAHMRHFKADEVEREVAQNLDFLTAHYQDLPARQRSLRAAFAYSWRLLSPQEQRVFAALAYFRGGFTPEAARQVAEAGRRTLAALEDKSLLRRDASGRYHLHALLRQYALEKSDERSNMVQPAFMRYFGAFLQGRASGISSPAQGQILREIRREMDNLRAAWQGAVAHPSVLMLFVEGLFEYYEIQGVMQEGAAQFTRALAALPEEPKTDFLRMKLLTRLARFRFRLGQRAEAEELLYQSLGLSPKEDARSEKALAYTYLGMVKQAASAYLEATSLYEKSLTLFEDANHLHGMSLALNHLGIIAYRTGALALAEQRMRASLALRRELGNPKAIADSLNNLGVLFHERGNYAQEAQFLEEALTIFRGLDDIRGISTILHNLGGVHLALQNFEQAKAYTQEALTIRQKFGDPIGVAYTLNNLGTIMLRSGNLAEVPRVYAEALVASWQARELPIVLDGMVGIADWLGQTGHPFQALELLAFVLAQTQDSDTRAEAQRVRARVAHERSPKESISVSEVAPPRSMEEAVVMAQTYLEGPL